MSDAQSSAGGSRALTHSPAQPAPSPVKSAEHWQGRGFEENESTQALAASWGISSAADAGAPPLPPTGPPAGGHSFGKIAIYSGGPLPVQTQLTIGQPNDPYEQEADRVADQVMRMADPPPPVQRQDIEEGALGIQRSPDPAQPTAPQPNLETRLNASRSGGSPLPNEVRQFMEPRFGFDFSKVKVHTDADAVQMNRELGAQAFAHGNHIYYGAGKSPANDHLTGHELTHVVQQTGTIQRQDTNTQANHGTLYLAAMETALRNLQIMRSEYQTWIPDQLTIAENQSRLIITTVSELLNSLETWRQSENQELLSQFEADYGEEVLEALGDAVVGEFITRGLGSVKGSIVGAIYGITKNCIKAHSQNEQVQQAINHSNFLSRQGLQTSDQILQDIIQSNSSLTFNIGVAHGELVSMFDTEGEGSSLQLVEQRLQHEISQSQRIINSGSQVPSTELEDASESIGPAEQVFRRYESKKAQLSSSVTSLQRSIGQIRSQGQNQITRAKVRYLIHTAQSNNFHMQGIARPRLGYANFIFTANLRSIGDRSIYNFPERTLSALRASTWDQIAEWGGSIALEISINSRAQLRFHQTTRGSLINEGRNDQVDNALIFLVPRLNRTDVSEDRQLRLQFAMGRIRAIIAQSSIGDMARSYYSS